MKSYGFHCALHGHNPPFPAIVTSLASWIAQLSTKRIKAKTIKSYITGLRSAHVDIGYEDLSVFHSPLLQRMIAGVRRLHGEADTKERLPLTKDLLLRLLSVFDSGDESALTMRAAFCLAFAGFLRIGEFTYNARDREDEDFAQWFLTRRSVRLYKDHLELTLPASKTDPFRQGITLTIAASNDDACPVRALRQMFHAYPASPSDPLFVGPRHEFHRDSVTATLRMALRVLGIEGHYSGHSFRRGAATSARMAGLSDSDIQLLGRWKSDSYRLYITTHPAHILAASRRHQHLQSHQR